ncbi:hypothetical protein [Flavobacterium sp. N1994]|uniref:hypothetical protein n=1 Tax=Flavobacterium sp. N1994 TaxID=2986827 RepID=UPI002223E26D|nr:hypothetical protein [Flavobacterium sp. N1994]
MSNNFKDFGITPEVNYFTGKSISIDEILNINIKVFSFKIEPSKKKANSDYLTLQIEHEDKKRVIFTGASILIQTIKKIPLEKFPFNTTIVKKNEYLEFT